MKVGFNHIEKFIIAIICLVIAVGCMKDEIAEVITTDDENHISITGSGARDGMVLPQLYMGSLTIWDATNKTQEPIIEGLTIYPNPTSGGKIYISSKLSLDKKVEIFNVLGKKVLETVITSKEVNVSNLTAGVYIIKIKEGEATATRKLIIN